MDIDLVNSGRLWYTVCYILVISTTKQGTLSRPITYFIYSSCCLYL